MILQHNGSVSPQSFLLESIPTRDKCHLEFHVAAEGTLAVNLLMPLDPEITTEKRAREAFSTDTLQARYRVKLDFEAERKTFADLVQTAYASDIGTILRRDELKRLEETQLRLLLHPLIEQGRNVFYKLFLSDQIEYERYTPEDCKIVQAALRSVFSRAQVLSIYSPAPLFPWPFLYYDVAYDPSKRSSIKPKKIWGFMHEIQEELETTPQRVSLPANFELVSAVDTDVDVNNWHSTADHPFTHLKPRPAYSIYDLGTALANFDGHCLYFFGHADHRDPPTQTSSWLELRKMRLTVSNLEIDYKAPHFNASPVVAFLNGCRTSPLTKWNENTVVGFLCIRGQNRLCCVASVGELPASFAAEFAKKFWNAFVILRKPIGTALLIARRHMLDSWNNPLGLLYSLFGRVDTFIKRDQDNSVNEVSEIGNSSAESNGN